MNRGLELITLVPHASNLNLKWDEDDDDDYYY